MKRSLSLMSLMLLIPAIGSAFYYDNRWALGASYGLTYPQRPDSTFKDVYDEGRTIGGSIQYGLSNDLSLVASYTNILLENENNDTELELQPTLLSFKYHPLGDNAFSPYFKLGAGYSSNRREIPGNASDQRWNKFAAAGGPGFEIFLNSGLSIGAEALYQHIVATADEPAFRMVSGLAYLNIYFGEDEKTKELRAEKKKAQDEAAALKTEKQNMADKLETSQQAAAAAQQSASQAQQTAAQAEQARLEAERMAQQKQAEAQAQVQAAQAEVNEIKAMVERKDISPINFQTGSDKLLVDSYPTLDKVAQTIAKYPNLKLRVEGHTDSVGSDEANLALSQKRSESVRTYLVNKAQVPAETLDAVGLGETKPVASNDSAEGRAQNRRVEFIFLVP